MRSSGCGMLRVFFWPHLARKRSLKTRDSCESYAPSPSRAKLVSVAKEEADTAVSDAEALVWRDEGVGI